MVFLEKYSYVRVLLIDGGALKKNTWPQYEKKQIQQPSTTFSNFSDKVAVLRGHENCCRFATLQWEHQRLDRRVLDSLIRGDAGVMAGLRNGVREKNGGRGASSCGLVRKIGFSDFFFCGRCGRCSTGETAERAARAHSNDNSCASILNQINTGGCKKRKKSGLFIRST